MSVIAGLKGVEDTRGEATLHQPGDQPEPRRKAAGRVAETIRGHGQLAHAIGSGVSIEHAPLHESRGVVGQVHAWHGIRAGSRQRPE